MDRARLSGDPSVLMADPSRARRMMPMSDDIEQAMQEEENGGEYENFGSNVSGVDDDEEEVVDFGEETVMNMKKVEVDLVAELHILHDVDPHADLVGEMLGRLMTPQGEKTATKTKDLFLCKQLFGLFAFLAVNEVHVSVNFVMMMMMMMKKKMIKFKKKIS
jgi:hypothetical protein